MSSTLVGLVTMGLFIALVLLGVRIAFAAATAGFIGVTLFSGLRASSAFIGSIPFSYSYNYALSVLPMFILMGNIAYTAGFARDIFRAAKSWLSQLPGGLALVTIATGAAFAAVCGATIASAAVLGKLAIPEMKRYGYNSALASGVVATAGTLAIMIPPSGMLVIYGILTEQPIGKLLIAGLFPGLMLTGIYAIFVAIIVLFRRDWAPKPEPSSWTERARSSKGLIPVGIAAIIIIGGIYTGVFTATEAGAIGSFALFVLGLILKRLNFHLISESLVDTAKVTGAIFFIIICVIGLSNALALTKAPYYLVEALIGGSISKWVVLVASTLVYLMLGMFFEGVGMLVLTLPVLFPIIIGVGFDPIWFGIYTVIMVETAMITPPVGLNVFTVHAAAPEIPVETIYKGAAPFVMANVVGVVILAIFPNIALFLPSLM